MHSSTSRLRIIVYSISFGLSVLLYLFAAGQQSSLVFLKITLARDFGLLAVLYLMLVLLAGPLYIVFPSLGHKQPYRSLLGPLGISTFYFAFLHASTAFFGLLQGFIGLPFLSGLYLSAVSAGFISLFILAVMTATSFQWAINRLGPRRKTIHRFVYLAGVLIVIHVLLIGSDFRNFTNFISIIFTLGFISLVTIQAAAFRKYLFQTYPERSSRFITILLAIIVLGFFYSLYAFHVYLHGVHIH